MTIGHGFNTLGFILSSFIFLTVTMKINGLIIEFTGNSMTVIQIIRSILQVERNMAVI